MISAIMSRLLAILFVLATLIPRVGYADARDREGRDHYRRGLSQMEVRRYEDALREFRQSFTLREDALSLYQMAQCYRALGDAQSAVAAYRSYLRRAPSAANRSEVEARIADMLAPKTQRPIEHRLPP